MNDDRTEEEIKDAADKIRKAAAEQPIQQQNPHPQWMSSLLEDKQKITSKIDAPEKGEDEIMAELWKSDAWKYLKKFIITRQKLFAELLKDKVAQSPFDMQEIGFRYVVSAQVEDVLGEIINRVEYFGKASNPEEPAGDETNGSTSTDIH